MDYIIPGILIALMIALLLFLLWLLFKLKRMKSSQDDDPFSWDSSKERSRGDITEGNESGDGSDGDGGESDREAAMLEALAEANAAKEAKEAQELRQKTAIVKNVLSKNDTVAKMLCSRAGTGHSPLQAMNDGDKVKEIARRLNLDDLQVYKLAGSQTDIQLDLRTEQHREPVPYPTNDMEPTQMTDFSQIPDIIDTQRFELGSKENYYYSLATQNVLIQQSYEDKNCRKLLYLLMDVSGSMGDSMRNQYPRHVFARGIAMNLLQEALNGKAKYFFRTFDGEPHRLRQVESHKEAEDALNMVEQTGFSGSGTDIPYAIATACDDIRSKGGDIGKADILLLTDGECSMDPESLKRTLGNIKLHTMVLGSSSEALEMASDTYKQIS